jgi:very-short-patch-repair endonuclease
VSPESRVRHLLVRQNGLVTLAQAIGNGVSARTVQRRVRSGAWQRLLPRVFLVGGHPESDAVRVRAAALWVGEPGAVSGPAAAWWHGMLPAAPHTVELTVPHRRAPRSRPDVRLRRRTLANVDLVGIDGVWLTDKPLTALETAAAVPDGSVFLDRALQRHVSFERVHRAYCRNLGAHGFARVGGLLVAAADRADSAAERRLVELLRAAGITGWVLGHPFGAYRIDLAFPEARLAVEIDGWAWHMDVDRFRTDRQKGNALVRDGWNLLRFTWHDLSNRPSHVVAEVRAALT